MKFRDSIMKCLSLIMVNTALQNDQRDFPRSPTCINSEVSFYCLLLKVHSARDLIKIQSNPFCVFTVSYILAATSEKAQFFFSGY